MRRTLLIVDDHPEFRASARALLQAEGFDVIREAADGAEALRAVADLHPQVVLLDVRLPGLDGIEVAGRLATGTDPPAVVLVSSRVAAAYGRRLREFHSNEPHRAGTQDNVFLIHPNGTGMHRITHTFGDHFEWLSSSFSPDGTMITVSRYPGHGKAGNADVYVMNVDGSDLRDVTNSFAWDSATDWGPDPS